MAIVYGALLLDVARHVAHLPYSISHVEAPPQRPWDYWTVFSVVWDFLAGLRAAFGKYVHAEPGFGPMGPLHATGCT
jgi:hypothetical protein